MKYQFFTKNYQINLLIRPNIMENNLLRFDHELAAFKSEYEVH